MDATGKVIQKIKPLSNFISLQHVSTGIYFAKFEFEHSAAMVRKFVKE
jgi:hypothetical protein